MVQEQWLQLNIKSLRGSNVKVVIYRGDEPLVRWNKNLVGGGNCRRIFSSGGMNKILAHGGTPIFS